MHLRASRASPFVGKHTQRRNPPSLPSWVWLKIKHEGLRRFWSMSLSTCQGSVLGAGFLSSHVFLLSQAHGAELLHHLAGLAVLAAHHALAVLQQLDHLGLGDDPRAVRLLSHLTEDLAWRLNRFLSTMVSTFVVQTTSSKNPITFRVHLAESVRDISRHAGSLGSKRTEVAGGFVWEGPPELKCFGSSCVLHETSNNLRHNYLDNRQSKTWMSANHSEVMFWISTPSQHLPQPH